MTPIGLLDVGEKPSDTAFFHLPERRMIVAEDEAMTKCLDSLSA